MESHLSLPHKPLWPRVHKETENEDQAQDQTYKLQLIDKKSIKFDDIFLPYLPE